MNQIPLKVWFAIALLILLNFVSIGIALHNPGGKSYPSVTIVKGIPGQIGLTGPTGIQGQSIVGQQGLQGVQGTPGVSVTPDEIASAISTYLQANPPAAGVQGEPGQNGAQVELRTNPITGNIEWKYDNQLNWGVLFQTCIITNSCPSP